MDSNEGTREMERREDWEVGRWGGGEVGRLGGGEQGEIEGLYALGKLLIQQFFLTLK